MKTSKDYRNEINELNRTISQLRSTIEHYEKQQKEIEKERYDISLDRHLHRNRIEEKDKQIVEYENEIHELKSKIYELHDQNNSISRIIKEKANVARNIHPKKKHSGYLLVYSNPYEYKYPLHGVQNKELLFQTLMQTPYDIGTKYEIAYKQILIDLSHKNKNGYHILVDFGAKYFAHDKRYEELVENEMKEIRLARYNELIEEYKKKHNYSPDSEEEFKLQEQAFSEELYYFFDMNIRINGMKGYWEVIFFSTCPLQDMPEQYRYKTKGVKDETKNKEI